ncbi:DUF4124 domain-containing protein [Marichromatium gracile]|uniref:DUF4124 domain-containing protein n=1 Tax=Marichromatium gracile TaxID=1048 RepID=UPI001F3EB54A|nr:DUF4124 domain-containing protein [Marichromatium gracile]MCF1182506.1 DUF4124 domain-containing protein [Marichromatium gracile]
MSKRSPCPSPLCSLVVAACLCGCLQQVEARLYRWVDETGNIHYSDVLPAESVDRGHVELDTRGVERETVPPAPSEAEIEAERARALAQMYDDYILANYRNEEDVRMVREGQLSALDARIQVQRDGIRRERTRLEALATERAGADQGQAETLRTLESEVIEVERRILEHYRRIVGLERSKDAARRRFAEVLERLRELRGLDGEAVASLPVPPHRLVCGERARCARDWTRAQAYLTERFAPPELHQSIDLLIARMRDEREVRVLTLARLSGLEGGTVLYLDLQCRNRLTGADDCIDAAAKAAVAGFRDALRPPR